MNISNTLYVANREDWRKWLKNHYKTEKEIWLVYYKKGSGKPRIAYNDAVEEALCFGWIDSNVKSLDKERFAQRFSCRNSKSPYSQANKESLKNLIAQGKVMKDILPTLGKIADEQFEIPRDILSAIKSIRGPGRIFRIFRILSPDSNSLYRRGQEQTGRIPEAPEAFHKDDRKK